MPELGAKQERFCQEFMIDCNATKAAERAGYSPRTARSIGSELLTKPDIMARIAALQAARAERVEVTSDEVLRALKILINSDVRDFEVDMAGNLTLRQGAADSAWKAVASVKHRITTRGDDPEDQFTVREVELRLWDKPKSLNLVMQHLGMLVQRHEHSGRNGTPLGVTHSIMFGDTEITF